MTESKDGTRSVAQYSGGCGVILGWLVSVQDPSSPPLFGFCPCATVVSGVAPLLRMLAPRADMSALACAGLLGPSIYLYIYIWGLAGATGFPLFSA